MPTCSCGGVSITCPGGCGCFCAGEIDCTRWCEPTVLDAFALSPAPARPAGFTRTIRNADGTDRLYINTMVTEPGPDLPRHTRGTTLQGCMQGSTLETIALMLGTLHGLTVTAPPGRGKETVEEQVAGTLDEIAMRFGLIVESSPAAS